MLQTTTNELILFPDKRPPRNCGFDKYLSLNNHLVPGPRRPWSPLHVACRQGNLDTVKLLIALGANVRTVNAGGHTPLHEAAYRGFDQILIELLKNGAKPNAISNQKRTPLHEACTQGMTINYRFLIDVSGNFVTITWKRD